MSVDANPERRGGFPKFIAVSVLYKIISLLLKNTLLL